jgi:hypothetical protein
MATETLAPSSLHAQKISTQVVVRVISKDTKVIGSY